MHLLRKVPSRLRGPLAVLGAVLFAGVIALIAALASAGSGHVTAATKTTPAGSPAQVDLTHGAVALSVQSALKQGGYRLRSEQNPVPIINDDYTEGTAWVWVNTKGNDTVYVVDNGLRTFVQGNATCLFHPAITGVDFTLALMDATSCTELGPTWTPVNFDVLDNVRQASGHVNLGDMKQVSADFTEAGAPLPQTKVPDEQKLQQAGYQVTGTKEMDGLLQQWSKAGSPSFYVYSGFPIMAIGTPSGWCKVPGGTIAAMLEVARVCLGQGPQFTVTDSGLKEGWILTPFGNEAVAFHSGAYFDYRP